MDEDIQTEFVDSIQILRSIPDGIEKSLSREQVLKILNETHSFWKKEPETDQLVLHLTTRFGDCQDGKLLSEKFITNIMTTQDLQWVYHREMFKRIRLETLLRQKHLMETAGDPTNTNVDDFVGNEIATKIGEIQDCIHRAYQCILSDLEMKKIYDKTVDRGCPPLVDPFGYIPFQLSKLSEYQLLIVFLLRKLVTYGYRRYQGKIYEQIISPLNENMKKYATHAWKFKCEIKQFIEDECRKETNFNHWKTITTANNLQNAEKYLSSCLDHEFAELKPNRLWHSFQNGVYCVENKTFFSFDDVPSYITTCKYHDQKFDTTILDCSWYDVPTPHIDSIIKYQFPVDGKIIKNEKEQRDVLLWTYGLIGRLLFEMNTKDCWQVMPFLIGKGQTGKSSLLKIIGKFYNDEDVAVISNNSQKGFGLETIYDKYIWECFEVKNDFTLDQGQLQSMISGENVSIQRKFKEALNVIWNTPGIIAGNEAPAWTDNSGSISRRFILIYFDKSVDKTKIDPNLEQKAKSQIGNLMHKVTTAYHELFTKFGLKDVWSNGVMPYYFHDSKDRLQRVTSDMYNFMTTDPTLTKRDDVYMPMKTFKKLYKLFCENNGKRFFWNEDKFKHNLEQCDIKYTKLDARIIQSKNLLYNNEIPSVDELYLFGICETTQLTNFEINNEMLLDTPDNLIQKVETVTENIVENITISPQKNIEDESSEVKKLRKFAMKQNAIAAQRS